jgi:hypothetical protein
MLIELQSSLKAIRQMAQHLAPLTLVRLRFAQG